MRDGSLLVVGMHRSGTSMVGGMLAGAGVRMGDRLIPADSANPRGYFEDVDVVDFHGSLFKKALPDTDAPHVDWGVVEGRALDRALVLAAAPEAEAIAQARSREGGLWGFKDPRTTMALDLWDHVLEDGRYLMVYRFPWEVADSMQRGGATVFTHNPDYAFRAWLAYNRELLAFAERNRDRCVVVSANALTSCSKNIPKLSEALEHRFGVRLDADDLRSGVDPKLLTAGDSRDFRADLVAAAYPECIEVLERLDAIADIPATGLWRSDRPARTRLSVAPEGDVSLSIVVPTWNDGVLLLEALASAERCAPNDAELIIVDDGSTDPESVRILDALKGQGYRVHSQPNSGLSSARNTAIGMARGRFVLPLDADNRLMPGFIEAAVAELERDPGAGIVYGDRRLFGALNEVLPTPIFEYDAMLGGNKIDACALYRRDMWERIGGYDTTMTGLEDWEFWLSAVEHGARFVHLDMVAFEYRLRPNSLLAVSLNLRVRWNLFSRLLERHAEAYHSRVPLPLRIPSLLLGNKAPDWLKRLETFTFWHPFWLMVGPGGLFATDRRMLRARKR